MKCCVCKKEIIAAEATILFYTEQLDKKLICEECKSKVDLLQNCYDLQKKVPLYNYFHECAKSCDDPSVKNYLVKMLQENGYAIEEGMNRIAQKTPVGTGWISLLRFTAWLEILGGFICAIVLGIGLGDIFDSSALGFGVAVIGIIMALILSAAIMIFLDMASDIRYIRNKIE